MHLLQRNNHGILSLDHGKCVALWFEIALLHKLPLSQRHCAHDELDGLQRGAEGLGQQQGLDAGSNEVVAACKRWEGVSELRLPPAQLGRDQDALL